MTDGADDQIRLAAFNWLTEQRLEHGEALSRSALTNDFIIGGTRIPLMGPSGIWKPAQFQLPISVTTVVNGPYPDAWDRRSGVLDYAYRGTDPRHRDNVGLRVAGQRGIPIIYFHAVERGLYAAAYPVFVVGDDPQRLFFRLQVDDLSAVLDDRTRGTVAAEDEAGPRRAYVTATFRRRLHQVAFRERVIRAYNESCALCRLRHRPLLDAAHITADSDPEGEPVVSNGLALCKLHHAAFDSFFFAVRPDYTVEVKPLILAERDGPMLIVGLQQIHDQQIELPTLIAHRPDRDRLARRYEAFKQAS